MIYDIIKLEVAMEKGIFITVEGTDGSGKTTQIKKMEAYLKDKGYDVILLREPGSTRISEKIRSLILDPENTEMGDTTELLLYAAARAQLISEIIKPSVEAGKVVICDRFIDSSLAYQGYGRGINLDTIIDINRVAIDGTMPDLTIFFDISPEIALERRKAATSTDRIEKEKMDFHMKVYYGYKSLAAKHPQRIKTVDSTRGIEEIFDDVRILLDSF